jgi:hypothetical protein
MGAPAVAGMIRREKDIIAAFQAMGALDAASARPLGALGLDESRHLDRLQRHGVIRKGSPGTWFVDEAAWTELGVKRRRIAVVLLAVSLFMLALGLGLLPATRG